MNNLLPVSLFQLLYSYHDIFNMYPSELLPTPSLSLLFSLFLSPQHKRHFLEKLALILFLKIEEGFGRVEAFLKSINEKRQNRKVYKGMSILTRQTMSAEAL